MGIKCVVYRLRFPAAPRYMVPKRLHARLNHPTLCTGDRLAIIILNLVYTILIYHFKKHLSLGQQRRGSPKIGKNSYAFEVDR